MPPLLARGGPLRDGGPGRGQREEGLVGAVPRAQGRAVRARFRSPSLSATVRPHIVSVVAVGDARRHERRDRA
eukprot:2050423-Pyramimonas_sp.AAC.1